LKRFNVQLTRSAIDDINKISGKQRTKIISSIENLSSDPFTPGTSIKKLRGFKPSLYRLRSGGYRVLYRVEKNTITIMRVIDRKELEKIIKRLKL
jgi:mRNA interferase RelE/StbE